MFARVLSLFALFIIVISILIGMIVIYFIGKPIDTKQKHERIEKIETLLKLKNTADDLKKEAESKKKAE